MTSSAAMKSTPMPARPVVAIVGRPNVGKSTLFNRLVGHRAAIVEDVPGVTRDRHYADAFWEGRPFTAVDTGGFHADTDDALLKRVREQARVAVQEAQLVVLVVDGMAGLSAADEELAAMLRKSGKPLFLAVNKMDSTRREEEEYLTEFYRLGLENVFATSAEHGRGIGELMDAVCAHFPAVEAVEEEESEDLCRVAIIGRPNVGKSTMVNRLLGQERVVASDLPGTTTDSVDTRFEHSGRPWILTDTAGIRRKRSISEKVEQFSVMRALASMERADVVLLMLDATEMAVEQDAKIASVAIEKGKPLVVFVNKWDLIEGTAKGSEYRNELMIRMPFVGWAPVIFGAAKTGSHVFKALETAGEVFEHARARVPTPQLNEFLRRVVDEHPAPLAGGNPVRLLYIAQTGTRPPTFNISCNRPEALTDDYKRFITNRMREAFGLRVPIRIIAKRHRSKTRRYTNPKKR